MRVLADRHHTQATAAGWMHGRASWATATDRERLATQFATQLGSTGRDRTGCVRLQSLILLDLSGLKNTERYGVG
jgi:hypothetical protein